VNVFLGNGDGTFPAASYFDIQGDTNAYSIAAADLNGDGKTDLVAYDDQEAGIFLSNGDGSFAASASTTGSVSSPDWDTIAVGDFNGDGIPDLVLADSDDAAVLSQRVQSTATATAAITGVSVPGSVSQNVTAAYAGDSVFSASTSSPIQLSATPLATTLNLSSSTNSSSFGQQITLTAILSPYADQSLTTNGETVTFSSGGSSLGTGTFSSGMVTLNIASLPVGTDAVMAVYAGDTNFAAATSSAVSIVVAGSTVTVSSNSSSLSVSSTGGSATANIQLSPAGGFSGTVNLACSVTYQGTGTATDAPTCSLNPTQTQIASGSTASTTLTVTTTAFSSARLGNPFLPVGGGALAALLLFVGVPRRRWSGWSLLAILCIVAAGLCVGCGGGGSGNNTPAKSGTTTGSYKVTVTATSGAVTASITLPLTVQ
jgi:hypothetical protein